VHVLGDRGELLAVLRGVAIKVVRVRLAGVTGQGVFRVHGASPADEWLHLKAVCGETIALYVHSQE